MDAAFTNCIHRTLFALDEIHHKHVGSDVGADD